jgi:hypothetical protein
MSYASYLGWAHLTAKVLYICLTRLNVTSGHEMTEINIKKQAVGNRVLNIT